MDAALAALYAAALGAGAALVGSLLNAVLTYLTSRSSNKAKRLEIVFERRLEAFREIYSAISMANSSLSVFCNLHSRIGSEKFYKLMYEVDNSAPYRDLLTIKSEFLKVYHKDRVFLPPYIDKKIQTYVSEYLYSQSINASSLTRTEMEAYITKVKTSLERHTESVLSDLQRFIGY